MFGGKTLTQPNIMNLNPAVSVAQMSYIRHYLEAEVDQSFMSNAEMEDENPHSTYSESSTDPLLVDLFSNETVDPVYQAKAHILNQAIQEIGMGKYQVSLK